MSEHAHGDYDDVLPAEPNGEVVHWMAPKPLAVGPAGISMAAAGAFVAGAAVTLAVLAVLHWVGPERTLERPRLPPFRRPQLKLPF